MTAAEADSTTNLKSWSSMETICFNDDISCSVCHTSVDLDRSIVEEIRKGDIFIYKSVVLVTCKLCESLTRAHCFLNQLEVSVNDLIDIGRDNICLNCRDGEEIH